MFDLSTSDHLSQIFSLDDLMQTVDQIAQNFLIPRPRSNQLIDLLV
jgi:hypothetical protein